MKLNELHNAWGKHVWCKLVENVTWNHYLYAVYFCPCGGFNDSDDPATFFPHDWVDNFDLVNKLEFEIQKICPEKANEFRKFLECEMARRYREKPSEI